MPMLKPAPAPIPVEQLRQMLIFGLLAELRINLYHDLKKLLGDRKGKEVHKELYNMSAHRSAHAYLGPHPTVRQIVMTELLNFPLLGFQLEGEVTEEDGEEVFYEHITRCPFWEYTKMKGFREMPCDVTCKYDSERAMKEEIGRWECISRLADGAEKCLFRIRPFKHYEQEEQVRKIMFNRTRLESKYTERFNDDY
jgi:hypothetical protein